MTGPVTLRDRARGALVGLAVGDALGAPVEFESPSQIQGRRAELRAMPGGGGFTWAPGEFTDDTQMSLVLARHLVANGGAVDQAALASEFSKWASDAVDVGVQTRQVLGSVGRGQNWHAAIRRLSPEAAGNGSLMRVAPVALAASSAEAAAALARLQSEVTHPNEDCQDACAIFARLTWTVIETGVRPPLEELASWASTRGVRDAVQAASTLTPKMSGWVLHTLTGALWAVTGADSFEEGVFRAVELGVDADTVGAVAGALAGATWGLDAIPADLASRLQSRHRMFVGTYPQSLVTLADQLTAIRR